MIARRSLSRTLVVLCAVVGGLLFVWSAPALAQREHVFSKSFGSEGSGDGELAQPGAVAVNEATGDVYVVDRGNERVEIFSSTGAYVGQFNGEGSPTGRFSWLVEDSREGEGGSVAVDSSMNPSDPSRGDVYVADQGRGVVDKFSASGEYLGQVTGSSPTAPFPAQPRPGAIHLAAIAVDPSGELWVQVGELASRMYVFNDAVTNAFLSSTEVKSNFKGLSAESAPALFGFALESEDNFYIGYRPFDLSRFATPAKFSKAGEVLDQELDGEETSGLAVDLSSDDVYVDHETSVAAYGPSNSLIERFGSPQMQASEGIAVDSATGIVYVSSASGDAVDVFSAFVVPDVSTGSASNFAETSMTVSGVVNPDGLPVTECVFEYGTTTAYGQSAACSPSPGSGSGPVDVSANLTGLEPLTKYHFRLKASNANGANIGSDRTFLTPEPVVLSEEGVTDVSSTSALFQASVDPGGSDTTYAFEYGTSVSYGQSVPIPAGDLGPETSSEAVAVRAEDLPDETTYHVRVVASNVLGTVYGPDETFTTQTGGGAFSLPDGREWELVSPPVKDGASIEPIGPYTLSGGGLIESSVDGSAISYVASGPVGSNVLGNPAPLAPTQVLSRRGADGWSSEDISPPHRAAGEVGENEYQFFSSDLSLGLVDPTAEAPLSPEATERTPYLRENASGTYLPLVEPNDVAPGTKFGDAESLLVIAATPDLSHELILSNDALTTTGLPLEPAHKNLYEWSAGRLQLVNVPGGTVREGAIAGRDRYFERGMLSSDGSRVAFESNNGGVRLYSRDMVTGEMVEVDEPAPGVSPPPFHDAAFQIASADGSMVFFTDEEPLTLDSKLNPLPPGQGGPSDLYVYDTDTGSLTDLSVTRNTGEQASVQRQVVGTNGDGTVVYFVARGVLAGGAEAGADNLYVESETSSSWSAPRLIGVLSEEDSNDWGANAVNSLVDLTSRVSRNGRYLAFMSDRSLTGYDNRDAISGQPDEEVFLYDEQTGQLKCVSCDPTGARPDGLLVGREQNQPLADKSQLWVGRWLAGNIPEWTHVSNPGGEVETGYPSRVVSDEGRLFFNSFDSLVAQDTNGKADVYEYEPEGVGCARPGGCVALISSGTSGEESAFLDASENGDDVFFLTAARLVRQDVDSSYDVYDAHICSQAVPCVSEPVSPPPCTSGDACKAAPSPQPAIFGAPSSATFAGAGNVAPSVAAESVSMPKRGAKRKPSHAKRKPKPKGRSRGRGRGKGKSSRARRSLSAGTRR